MEGGQGPRPAAGMRIKSQLMSASEIDRTLMRLAHEIVERHNGIEGLVLVGIRRRGMPLATRLAQKIADIEKRSAPVGNLDITSYRDDLSTADRTPGVPASTLPFSVAGLDVILVDDVLYTGRTTRALGVWGRLGAVSRVPGCPEAAWGAGFDCPWPARRIRASWSTPRNHGAIVSPMLA